MKPNQYPLTNIFYNPNFLISLLSNVPISYTKSGTVSQIVSITLSEEYAFVMTDNDASDLTFPALSPLSADYIIQMYPANDG